MKLCQLLNQQIVLKYACSVLICSRWLPMTKVLFKACKTIFPLLLLTKWPSTLEAPRIQSSFRTNLTQLVSHWVLQSGKSWGDRDFSAILVFSGPKSLWRWPMTWAPDKDVLRVVRALTRPFWIAKTHFCPQECVSCEIKVDKFPTYLCVYYYYYSYHH